MRFSTPSALAGHARVASRGPEAPSSRDLFPLRPFVTDRPARCGETYRRDVRPCGFSLVQRTRRDEARVADVRAGRWNRIRRSRCFPFRPALRRAAGILSSGREQRLDGLLPVAPYVFDRRASGATGETDSARAAAVRPLERLRYPSVRSSHSRVIRQFASFFRVAFRYPCDRSVTWPGDAGLPSFVARRHSWGFNSRCRAPFAGLIPLTGGCVSRRRAARTHDAADRSRGSSPDRFPLSAPGVSAGPGPRAVAAARPRAD